MAAIAHGQNEGCKLQLHYTMYNYVNAEIARKGTLTKTLACKVYNYVMVGIARFGKLTLACEV